MKLRSRSQVPPGLFTFRHPTSGLEMSRHAWTLLRDDVTAHTTANGYPVVSDEEIERQICERLGPRTADTYCEGEGITVRGVGIGWREVWQGTKTLGSFLLAGRPLVSKDEAERRASICLGCPRNIEFDKPCGGMCPELQEVVSAIVGEGTTHFDDRLGACSVCACSLKSKVWVPLDILQGHDSPENQAQYPEFCWQKVKSA